MISRYERHVLLWLDGQPVPEPPASAARHEALEKLRSVGYVDLRDRVTPRGQDALNPAPEKTWRSGT
jgi:hypothetical protein